jgi:hypothetical protein
MDPLIHLIAAFDQMVRKGGVEPPPLAGLDPKSSASANSATFAVALLGLHVSGYVNDYSSRRGKSKGESITKLGI